MPHSRVGLAWLIYFSPSKHTPRVLTISASSIRHHLMCWIPSNWTRSGARCCVTHSMGLLRRAARVQAKRVPRRVIARVHKQKSRNERKKIKRITIRGAFRNRLLCTTLIKKVPKNNLKWQQVCRLANLSNSSELIQILWKIRLCRGNRVISLRERSNNNSTKSPRRRNTSLSQNSITRNVRKRIGQEDGRVRRSRSCLCWRRYRAKKEAAWN